MQARQQSPTEVTLARGMPAARGPAALLAGWRGAWLRVCLRLTLPLFGVLMPAFAAQAQAFDLQGHRGARGVAPENTLAAFRAALAAGVTTLELDVHLTADGEVVVTHDPRLNASFTRDVSGRWIDEPGPAVLQLTLAELQRHDVGAAKPGTRYVQLWPERRDVPGERVPTLAALFDEVKRRGASSVRFNIETKLNPNTPELTPAAEPFAQAVLDVVRRHEMSERVSIQSFDWRTLAVVQRLAPRIPTVALSARQNFLDNISDGRWTAGHTLAAHDGSLPKMVKAAGAAVWSPFHGDLTEALLAEAKALGLKVVPWTVNDAAIIERLLDWRVDGLITDYPERVRAAMARRAMPLPPSY